MKNQPFASCIVHCFHIVDFIYRNCRPPAHRVHPGQSSHATVYIVNLEPFACVCVSTYIYIHMHVFTNLCIYTIKLYAFTNLCACIYVYGMGGYVSIVLLGEIKSGRFGILMYIS
jgi:hypothetical protein